MIEVIEYTNEFKKEVAILIDQLQEHIVAIDPPNLLTKSDGYGEKYLASLIKDIKNTDGVLFLAKDSENIVGLISGMIKEPVGVDKLAWKPFKTGRIEDFVVSKDYRNNGVGKILLERMEEYFKSKNCLVIRIMVMQNNDAYKFYTKHGYTNRVVDLIKPIKL